MKYVKDLVKYFLLYWVIGFIIYLPYGFVPPNNKVGFYTLVFVVTFVIYALRESKESNT